jgi:glucose/arabinose dehydrogenase
MRRLHQFIFLGFFIPALIASCDSAGTGDDDGGGGGGGGGGGRDATFVLEDAFPGVTFESPVDLQNAGDGTGRLFVVEQRGVIMAVTPLSASSADGNTADAGTRQEEVEVFLDIQDRVLFDEGERGLLGLAFHPDYENNGFFYVNYNADNPNRTVISRFSVREDDPGSADTGSELIILEFNQPSANHKGGQLAFGPEDGFLYIAVGDGGAGGEPAQDLTSLLGSILRIDVDNPGDGKNYGIPPGNPFAGNGSGFREEIFAYGFRNPWRFGFDDSNGRLFVGDVGQDSREEIDVVENGKNYGWDIMEGSLCFNPPSGCDMSGLEPPIHEYGRDEGGTIIGGPVYRGSIPELFGKLIYGDFLSGTIWALVYNGSSVTENREIVDTDDFTLSSFGRDEEGEIYACSLDGIIYKLIKE